MQTFSLHSLASLNQTAAVLLAAAVVDLFPGVLIANGQGTPERFFWDFVFPFEFQPDFLTLIEERMRFILREKKPVKLLEMMPSNAAAMMRHRGQFLAADALLELNRATVEMCQIGEFIAYSSAPFLKELAIPFLKLFESFPLDTAHRKRIRIVGAAAKEKDFLKALAKQPSVSSRSHQTLAREMGMLEPLAEEGFWMWCPKGELLRRRWVQFWQEQHAKQGVSLVSSPAAFLGKGDQGLMQSHREYFLRFGAPKVAEIALVTDPQKTDPSLGLFSLKAFFVDRTHLFFPDEKLLEECISSLQFILNIPKILRFEFEIVLSLSSQCPQKARAKGMSLFQQALEKAGVAYTLEKEYRAGILASIDVRIPDALGRRWTGPFLRLPEAAMPEGKGNLLVRSAFGSLERMTALLLEKKGGWLPLFLVSEQVRILIVSGKSGLYANQVNQVLGGQGIRATVEGCGGALKARLYKAMMEKVPYVIVLGEKEEKAKILTVRAYGENKEQTMSLDEFCVRLKCEMESKASELTN
jgi:threonyl-tRNA synthetase